MSRAWASEGAAVPSSSIASEPEWSSRAGTFKSEDRQISSAIGTCGARTCKSKQPISIRSWSRNRLGSSNCTSLHRQRTLRLGWAPPRSNDRFTLAVSTGRCNTLSESHCLAKMSLNQSNSQRFTGTPSSDPWEHWQPGSTVQTTVPGANRFF